MNAVSYAAWVVLAIETFAIWLLVEIAVNSIFYRDRIVTLKAKLLKGN